MNQAAPAKLSVVVPAYREANGIAALIDEIVCVMESVDMAFEIIIVDDGSPDATFRRVQEISRRDRRVRGLRFSRNFGKEAALLAGLQAATGHAVITIDADLQHPPGLIPALIDAWRGGAKIVNAVKRNRGRERFVARWGADVFNASISKLGGIDLKNSSDFKLLDRQAVDAVVELLPERQRFFRGLADWIGFAQVSIPFDVAERRSDESSWPLRALFQLAFNALVSFTSAPLRIVAWLGILAMGIGAIIAADALWSWLHGNAVSGFATTIMTLLLLGSFIMISLGIIGEYIAKIYDEVKRRPAYLIESSCGDVAESVGMPEAADRRASTQGASFTTRLPQNEQHIEISAEEEVIRAPDLSTRGQAPDSSIRGQAEPGIQSRGASFDPRLRGND
jgi:glycosyltransferase involved in cell wall biosynthesis